MREKIAMRKKDSYVKKDSYAKKDSYVNNLARLAKDELPAIGSLFKDLGKGSLGIATAAF